MQLSLTPHPDTPCDAVSGIDVDIRRTESGALALRFVAKGDIGALSVPPKETPRREGGLWRRTCLEAFFRAPDDSYLELNLAPSTHWAAYTFSGYRERISGSWHGDPGIEASASEQTLEVSATVVLPPAEGWLCGLAAVIEEANGRLSYWALAHPPGKPDFHHLDGFVLELESA